MATPSMFAEDWIRPDGRGGVIIGDASPMPAEHLPQLIAWIYEASGKQLITLPRCEITASGESGPGWHATFNGDGTITVRAVRLPSDEARTLAAVIASAADQTAVEPESDRAEVERMAAFFNEAMDTDPETLARRLLADFDVKERAA